MSSIYERVYQYKISEKLNFISFCDKFLFDELSAEGVHVNIISNQHSGIYATNRENSFFYAFIFGYLTVLSKNFENQGDINLRWLHAAINKAGTLSSKPEFLVLGALPSDFAEASLFVDNLLNLPSAERQTFINKYLNTSYMDTIMMAFKVMSGMQLITNMQRYPHATPEDLQNLLSANKNVNIKFLKCIADLFNVRMHIYKIDESAIPKSINESMLNYIELTFIYDSNDHFSYVE